LKVQVQAILHSQGCSLQVGDQFRHFFDAAAASIVAAILIRGTDDMRLSQWTSVPPPPGGVVFSDAQLRTVIR
jgi:hypothetical protein